MVSESIKIFLSLERCVPSCVSLKVRGIFSDNIVIHFAETKILVR